MFVSENLEAARDRVVDLYQQYLRVRGDVQDQVDLDRLAGKIDRVRNLSVLLVVAGEVNSGKSSFVNALLGTDLLPVSTLQMSSAIVEITHAVKRSLQVTYADDHVDTIGEEAENWDEEVAALLKRVAAVPDEYRDLPIIQLRQIAGLYPGKTRAGHLRELAKSPATNPKLTPESFVERAQAFIKAYGDPAEVATHVRIAHPLPHGSSVVTVVDTPGVDAVGGVESVTHDYIGNADALLFVKSLVTSVESQSFRRFVDDHVGDKLKEALFLILTNASRLNSGDREDRIGEAHRHYDAVVGSPQRIVAVDSVMKAVSTDAADVESADALLNRYDDEADAGSRLSAEKSKLLSPLARREKDLAVLRNQIEDAAGFRSVHTALERFATLAPYIQIAQALDTLLLGLGNLAGHHREQQGLNAQGNENPDALRTELERRENEITKLENAVTKSKESLVSEFLDPTDGIVTLDVEQKKSYWSERIRNTSSEAKMKTESKNAIAHLETLRAGWRRQLLERCDSVLREHKRALKLSADIQLPQIDIDAIAERIREDNTNNTITGTFKKKLYRLLDPRFLSKLRSHLQEVIIELAQRERTRFEAVLDEATTRYNTELHTVLGQKKNDYQMMRERQQTAQEYADRAADHARVLSEITGLHDWARELRDRIAAD